MATGVKAQGVAEKILSLRPVDRNENEPMFRWLVWT